jgi:beta-xylosidase
VRDGPNYYLTFSSFDAYPGLPVWRSTDLVNWQPIGPTLSKPVGSVWAPELVHHAGRFYNYFHARTPEYRSLYVITADRIEGPWSDPVDLKLHAHIDPGHVLGEDGRRYLFLSGGDRVRLSDDGLATKARSSMSTTRGITRRTGWSRPSRPRGRKCCAMAAGSISSSPWAVPRGHRPATW